MFGFNLLLVMRVVLWCCTWFYYDNNLNNRQINSADDMSGSFRPEFTQSEIEFELEKIGAKFEILDEEKLISKNI